MNPRRVAFFYNNPSGLQPEEAELANILYLAWASATLLLNRRNCQTRGSAIFVFIMWWNKTREPGWCHPQPGRHRLPCKPPRLCYASPLGLATGDHFPPYGYIFLNKKTICFGFISSNFQLVNKWPGNLVDASPNRGGTGIPCKPQRLCHTSPLGLAIGDHFSPQWVHSLEQENKSALDLYPALPLSTNDLWKLMES